MYDIRYPHQEAFQAETEAESKGSRCPDTIQRFTGNTGSKYTDSPNGYPELTFYFTNLVFGRSLDQI